MIYFPFLEIHYVTYKLDQSNNNCYQLEELIRKFYGDGSIDCVLVTLHGCGDLQPMSYELFATSDFIKVLLGVGCCYHKMAYSEEGMSYHLVMPYNLNAWFISHLCLLP